MILTTADAGAALVGWTIHGFLLDRIRRFCQVRETGMSFGRWRQQFHIILALQWLSQGASVQSVATGLGYESASSFVVMFRKALGASPARYMTQRLVRVPAVASEAFRRMVCLPSQL